MRSADLHPGHTYLLSGDRGRVVEILDTPPELRQRAHVRVRFTNGVKAGEVADVPSRRIIAALTGPATTLRPRQPVARPLRIHRDPRVGDEVLWAATGDLVWTVQQIDADRSQATLNTVIMQRATTQTVALAELEVRPLEPSRPLDEDLVATRIHVERIARDDAPAPPEEHGSRAPDKPQRELEALLDGVLFSRRCLDQYRSWFGRDLAGSEVGERIRDEIRRRGYVYHENGADEYARLRVEWRFEVVLPRDPRHDDAILIDELRLLARRRRRQTHSGPPQSKASGPQRRKRTR